MVIFLSHKQHQYAGRPLEQIPGARLMSYDQLFSHKRLKAATYVFCDLDRLSFWELELAGRFYVEMRFAGFRVLNNPARVKQRFALLRALNEFGINDFTVYRPASGQWPKRYPVFVRRDTFHDGVLTDLIHDRPTLESELERIAGMGVPEMNTMVVEYAAAPERDDIFVKYTLFRIGNHYFPDACVTERKWVVKYGELGCMEENDFIAETERMRTVPYQKELTKAFEIANIDYGRLDYGLLNGRPQVYEINTNPTLRLEEKHHSAHKLITRKIIAQNFERAVSALQTSPKGKTINLSDRILCKQVRRERWFQRSRPTI